jgi:hypothetical protein
MIREEGSLEYFMGFDFTGDALFGIDRSRPKEGREIRSLRVRENRGLRDRGKPGLKACGGNRSYVSSERELIPLLTATVDLLAKLTRAHPPQMSRRYVLSRCPSRRTSPSERIPRPDQTCCLWQYNGRSGQVRLPFSWERDKAFSCKSMFQRALQNVRVAGDC